MTAPDFSSPLGLQMQILMQNFQQANFREHVFPEISGCVPVGVGGVPFSADDARAVAALVKRQKVGCAAFQPRGHIDVAQVHGKVHQHAVVVFKDGVVARAVELVLRYGVCRTLAGELALELHGHHGDAVEQQYDIDAVFVVERVVQLPRAVENVCRVLLRARFVDGSFRLPVNGTELDSPVGKALPQYAQKADMLDFPAETLDHLAVAVRAVDFFVLLPAFGLAGLDKGKERRLVERELAVEGCGGAFGVAAEGAKVLFDILLKALFGYVEVSHN